MSVSLSSWFVILMAVVFANLPFMNEQVLGFVPLRLFGQRSVKPFWVRLIELALLYALLGVIARLLERQIGNAFAQGWEFYAITGCLYIVLAYPGFVFRYLRKRRG